MYKREIYILYYKVKAINNINVSKCIFKPEEIQQKSFYEIEYMTKNHFKHIIQCEKLEVFDNYIETESLILKKGG